MNIVAAYDAERRCWVEYSQPIEVVRTGEVSEVISALEYLERIVAEQGVCAAGFISYEAAPAFDDALKSHQRSGAFPLLWFGVFERADEISPSPQKMFSLDEWIPNISPDEYHRSIDRIKHYIAAGDTYQVNFSFRLRAGFHGDPFAFCLALHDAQRASYSMFINTDDFAVCSASPELFFRLDGDSIRSRPMKGTAPRERTFHADMRNAEALRSSDKDRAENVMIVDMIRNDIGRIAEVESVRVPHLFSIEKYPTLWQMTSTVEGTTNASLVEILKALFPCASITGAPKARTMEIIRELESTPRKIYTGAIGIISPNRKAQLAVAIRTVLIDKRNGTAEYGTGGGVTWGSTAEGEYEECFVKARVLTDVRPSFELFETMLFARDEGFFLLDEHMERLKQSAAYFDLPLQENELMRMIARLKQDLPRLKDDLRVRLDLHNDGAATFALRGLRRGLGGGLGAASDEPVQVKFAASPVDSSNVFLYHKTTFRKVYDDALASVTDCDDVILWNERGESTEATIANIVVERDGEFVTPPVECGLLAGTFRNSLLKEGKVKERVIMKNELQRASKLFLINSVRKWRRAVATG